MSENKTTPDWMTDDFLAEMRRLEGSSKLHPMKDIEITLQLWHEDKRNNGTGGWIGEEPGSRSYLTDAGHAALRLMAGPSKREPWAPKSGDRVRVEAGSNFLGKVGTVKRTGAGLLGEITVVAFAESDPCAEGCVLTANLEPTSCGYSYQAPNGDLRFVPPTQESVAKEIQDAIMGAVLSNPKPCMPEEVNVTITGGDEMTLNIDGDIAVYSGDPHSIADHIIRALSPDSNPRADGHSTGPILTGDARESYLAIQSGAEDPHAKPEPLTEPSCGYCKDTGIGETGMRCPVRTCEAVST